MTPSIVGERDGDSVKTVGKGVLPVGDLVGDKVGLSVGHEVRSVGG